MVCFHGLGHFLEKLRLALGLERFMHRWML